MKKILTFSIVLAVLLGVSPVFAAFSDPFKSIQLAPTPSNGNCLTTDGTNNLWGSCGPGGSGSPGGSNTQVQFNDAGSFGGSSLFTFLKGSGLLTVTSIFSTFATTTNLLVTGSSTLQNFTALNSTSTNATTTTFFTNLLKVSGLGGTSKTVFTDNGANGYRQTFDTTSGSSLRWAWGDSVADNTYLEMLLAGGQNRWNNKARDLVFQSTAKGNILTLDNSTGTVNVLYNLNVSGNSTTSALGITSIISKLLKTDSNGSVVGAVANTDYQSPISLTTTGSSGAATFNGTTLNIPQYSGGSTASSTLLGDNNTFSGNNVFSNLITGSISGNAGTATLLQNARTINGVSFNGGSNITIQAASSTLLADNNNFSGNTTLNQATTTNLAITGLANGSNNLLIIRATGNVDKISLPLTMANGGLGVSSITSGNLIYGTGSGPVASVATTSVSCSGTVTCTSFTAIGASPITINGSSGTSASSTLLSDNNSFTGNNTFVNATATNLFSTTASSSNLFTAAFSGAGLTNCVSASNALTWNSSTRLFGCNTISAGSSASSTLYGDNGNFTGTNTFNKTSTIEATSTSFFATQASTSKLYLATGNGLLKNVNGLVSLATAGTDYAAAGNYITALTGDVTATGPGSVAATLATVNGNVGSFGGVNSIPSFTVNAKGLITAASANVPSIPASEITNGTFGTGNYVFPADAIFTGSATTTNLAVTNNASTTNFYGAGLTTCNTAGTSALTYTGTTGRFGCNTISAGSGDPYPFKGTGNSTSTLTQFNAGLTAFSSSTISALTVTNGTTTNATTTGQMAFGTGTTFTGINAASVNSLDFWTSGIWRGGFSNVGNLGIGTTTPNWSLQVASVTSYIAITDTDAAVNRKHILVSNLDGVFRIGTSSDSLNSTSSALSLDPGLGAQLGVGTSSPWRTLSVTGTVGFDGLTASASASNFYVCMSPDKQIVNSGSGTSCTLSSMFIKHDIASIDSIEATNAVLNLRPVSYVENESGKKLFGFIAEEVENVDPLLVEHAQQDITIDGHAFLKGDPINVDYSRLTPIIIKYLQDHSADVKRSVEENYQWLAIAFLFSVVLWQGRAIKKLQK